MRIRPASSASSDEYRGSTQAIPLAILVAQTAHYYEVDAPQFRRQRAPPSEESRRTNKPALSHLQIRQPRALSDTFKVCDQRKAEQSSDVRKLRRE